MNTRPAWARSFGLAALSIAIAWSSAIAFKPNEAGHLGITTEGLAGLGFSERALDEIRDANRNTDIVTFFGVAEHFDDEAFEASSQRLIDLKNAVIQKSIAGDGQGARRDLGGALHTVQDFYSHSNWVELGNGDIEPNLGVAVLQDPPLDLAFCPTGPGTLDLTVLETTTGYFPFPDPCELPVAGKCLHGVELPFPPFEPICEGINKDAPYRQGFQSARSLAVTASTTYTNQILAALEGNDAALATLLGASAPGGGRILMIAAGLAGGAFKTYAVPVDSTVEKLKFRSSPFPVEVLRPSGQPVRAGDPGVTITDESGTRTVKILDPESGAWTARFAPGDGKFALDVIAKSPLQIDRFDLVTFSGGRPGHEGFAPISGEPTAKSEVLALAQLIGPISSKKFSLVDVKGKTLQSVSLAGNSDAGANELLGRITIPLKPFRFAVTGVDASGTPFQRVFPRLYQPK